MTNPITFTVDYFRSARAELEKVTWPSRIEVIRYTALVIGVSVVLAAFFAALDVGLNLGISALVNRHAPTAAPATQNAPVVPDLQPSAVQATDKNGNPIDIQATQ